MPEPGRSEQEDVDAARALRARPFDQPLDEVAILGDVVVVGEVERGFERIAEQRCSQRREVGEGAIEARIDAPGNAVPAAGTADLLAALAHLKQAASGKLSARSDQRLDGARGLADQHGDRPPEGTRDVGEHVAEILHLIVAAIAGDQADDLESGLGQAELASEQLDIARERLGPRRLLGGAAEASDQLLALAPIEAVELGIGEAAGIVGRHERGELVVDGEVHEAAALVHPIEDAEQPA